MLIIQDAITDPQIDAMRRWIDHHPETKYVNWIQDGKLIDHRWTIDLADLQLSFVTDLAKRYFHSWSRIWSAYQIQTNPHDIHVDEYATDDWPNNRCWTFVLAFDTVPEFKTIIWQEEFHNGISLSEWIEHTWIPQRKKLVKNDTSQRYDLEHTYDHHNEDYLADYLTLEGVFSYQRGHAVLFDGNKLHCTSNWRKYPQFDHRELLQVHVLSNQPRFHI